MIRITGAYLISKLREVIKEKRRGNLRKVVFLHDDNEPRHTSAVAKVIARISAISLYLAPRDYRLFLQLKEHLLGKIISFRNEECSLPRLNSLLPRSSRNTLTLRNDNKLQIRGVGKGSALVFLRSNRLCGTNSAISFTRRHFKITKLILFGVEVRSFPCGLRFVQVSRLKLTNKISRCSE